MSVSLCFMPPIEQYQRVIRLLEAVEGYDQVALMLSLQDDQPLATVAFPLGIWNEWLELYTPEYKYVERPRQAANTQTLANIVGWFVRDKNKTLSPQLLAALEDCLTYCRNYPYADLEWK